MQVVYSNRLICVSCQVYLFNIMTNLALYFRSSTRYCAFARLHVFIILKLWRQRNEKVRPPRSNRLDAGLLERHMSCTPTPYQPAKFRLLAGGHPFESCWLDRPLDIFGLFQNASRCDCTYTINSDFRWPAIRKSVLRSISLRRQNQSDLSLVGVKITFQPTIYISSFY